MSYNASVCILISFFFKIKFIFVSDAHWGNILYSRERGIQLIDFGIATLVDRFELPNYKATLIITFTLDRCLDCEASKQGRDFQQLIKDHYPVNGYDVLSHPWLKY